MDEAAKKEIAVFRFGVIADIVGRKLARGEKERIIREKALSRWEIPFSTRTHISRSTIVSWVRAYAKSRNLESLYPEDRKDRGRPRAIDDETVASLVRLKKECNGMSLPVLIKAARQRGILTGRLNVSYATLYRIFKLHGVSGSDKIYPDRRRFEAELPNDIWQSDCLHGPKVFHDGKMRKSYLFAFIDDMTRLVPHAEFYLSERIDSFIDNFIKALAKRGMPRKLYVDNGPVFSTQILRHATASLGIALIHSRPYQPEGRGKIERFFRTVRMQLLSTIDDGINLEDLNRKLGEWIDVYHTSKHSATKEAPLNRYANHLHLIREAPKHLMDHFRKRVNRKVDRDRIVSLDGRLYEAPVSLIGSTVTLLYHESDLSRIEVIHNGQSHGMLVSLDVHVNARVKRSHQTVDIVPCTTVIDPDSRLIQDGRVFGKEDVE